MLDASNSDAEPMALYNRICALVLLLGSGEITEALGQETSTTKEPTPFENLATAIQNHFFEPKGNAGSNWCFAIEYDPVDNVWNFARRKEGTINDKKVPYKEITPYRINYAARIRIRWKEDTDKINYGSIFMGFDLGEEIPYEITYSVPASAFVLDQAVPESTGNQLVQEGSNVKKIHFPEDECGTLAEGLKKMFWRGVQEWNPEGQPTCNVDATNTCGVVTVKNPENSDEILSFLGKEVSGDSKKYPSIWTFKGQTHSIPRAVRFAISINGKILSRNGKTPYYFVVGYGGSGGAG
jgi:hypothetical protein